MQIDVEISIDNNSSGKVWSNAVASCSSVSVLSESKQVCFSIFYLLRFSISTNAVNKTIFF